MTQAEKKMKSYVNAVEWRLNLPREVKARVMSDFQSSIGRADRRGNLRRAWHPRESGRRPE